MLYAVNDDGNRVRATRGARAACPGCRRPVIAKCGEIKVWHWSHMAGPDCDPWWEPESMWHLGWKDRAPEEAREIVIGAHRADIVGVGGVVIELQHSPISQSDIKEREAEYGNMVWLFDARSFARRITFKRLNEGRYSFRWPHWRPSMGCCKAPIFWDVAAVLGPSSPISGVLQITQLFPAKPSRWHELWRDESGNVSRDWAEDRTLYDAWETKATFAGGHCTVRTAQWFADQYILRSGQQSLWDDEKSVSHQFSHPSEGDF